MIEQLKKDITELEAFKVEMERQQLHYPIDKNSMSTIREGSLYALGSVEPIGLAPTFDESTTIKTRDKTYLLNTTSFVDIGL